MIRFFLLIHFFSTSYLGISQHYIAYKSHPRYMDSVLVFTNTEGFLRNGRENILEDSISNTVNQKIYSTIQSKCKNKLVPLAIQLDTTNLKLFKNAFMSKAKSFNCDNCLIRDKTYLREVRFPDSICSLVKHDSIRFIIAVQYVYYYNDNLVQNLQKIKTPASYNDNGSQRELYIMVIDLETGYPVYFETAHSQHRLNSIPRDLDIGLDFYSFNRFFKEIKK